MKVLIISCHPDDDLLSCAHILFNVDNDIYILYVSSGKEHEIEKREAAIKECINSLNSAFNKNYIHQKFLRANDTSINCKDIVRISNVVEALKSDRIYIPAFEIHPLHKAVNKAFKIIPTFGARCYEYVVYGRSSFFKKMAAVVNIPLAGFDILLGGPDPTFEKNIKPYMVYNFTEQESFVKGLLVAYYRKLVGDPYIRLLPYKREIFREVKL